MKAVSIDKAAVDLKVKHKKYTVKNWTKQLVLRWLGKLTVGRLMLKDGDDVYIFGQSESETSLSAIINIHNDVVYRDLIGNGIVGAGEAYIRGAWTADSLVNAVRIFAANFDNMQSSNNFRVRAAQYFAGLSHRFFRINNKENSRLNIAAHYDLGNDFFKLFLDKSMMYSSAIYSNEHTTLEAAASYKLEHICQRLQLQPQDHLLEIGTGWGGMAIYAAKHYGCQVTTTTISKEQYEYACQQVINENLQEKVTVLLDDYRDLEGKFDKLVSIEMIEAVGHQYYSQYFNACSRLLKNDGLMLIQAITVPDQRYHKTLKTTDFIQRYIFPGGELPCVDIIARHISEDTNMQMVGLEDITLDYAKTLNAWRERFLQQLEQVKLQGFDDVFVRMWDFYLAYCEGGFKERAIGTIQVLCAKPRCQLLPHVATAR